MNIRIGNKTISYDEALQYYRNKKECKKHFNLTSKEYHELIDQMTQATNAQKLQIQSFDNTNTSSTFATLQNFNNKILPDNYQPISSNQQQVQQLTQSPADQFESQNIL